MFRNVIVGVDHQEGGHDAIALAQQLVSAIGRLTLAHVYTGDPYVYRGVSAEYTAAERKRDLDLLAQARAEAGVDAELRWHRASSVVDGLDELCTSGRADLLVIGASQRRGSARLLDGDEGQLAPDRDARAVAVAPGGYRCEPAAIEQIGVGYDGSAASRDALRVARDLARAYGSRLSAFAALDAPIQLLDTPVADEMAQAAQARIGRLGIAEAHAAPGRPSEELTLFSRVVDLLLIGAPGHVVPGRPRRSGVARELARSTRCPLLVVRAAPAADEPANGDESRQRERRDGAIKPSSRARATAASRS